MKGIKITITGGDPTDRVALSALLESALALAFDRVDNQVQEFDVGDISDPRRVRAILNLAGRSNPELFQTVVTITGESDEHH